MARLTDREYLENCALRHKAALLVLESATTAPHHQSWFLDQALRSLLKEEYDSVIAAFESVYDGEWDVGTPP